MIIYLSLLWIFTFFAIFSIIGFVNLNIICSLCKKKIPRGIEWTPLYCIFGLITTEIVFFVLCFVYIDLWVAYFYVVFYIVIFIRMLYSSKKKRTEEMKHTFLIKGKSIKWGILFVFIFIAIIFGIIGYQMDSAPFGDAFDHATVVSMIIENRKFPSNYFPVDDMLFSVFRYPPGFRCLSVFTSLFSFSSPMISITFTSVLSSTLIPLLIWSSVYLKTKSIILSLIALLCSLIIPNWVIIPPLGGNDFVIGNLINGTYPNQLGFTELIGLSAFLIQQKEIKENDQNKIGDPKSDKGQLMGDSFSFIGMTIIGFSIILTHYLFTIFVLAIFGIRILAWFFEKILKFQKKNSKRIYPFILGFCFLIVGLGIPLIIAIKWVIPLLINVFSFSSISVINPDFFINNPFGLICDISIAVFIIKLCVSRKSIFLQDFYFIVSISIIYAVFFFPVLESYFLITADRCVIPVTGIAIMQMCCDSSLIILKIKESRKWTPNAEFEEKIRRDLVIIIISLNVINTLAYPQLAVSWGVVIGSDDYEGIVWLNENVDKNTLVLNEPTFVGLFLPGYRWRNVVFVRQLSTFHSTDTTISYYGDRASSAMEIFTDPANYTNVKNIMITFQITYLYLTSFSEFYDYSTYTRIQKPYDVADQVANFSANPYLELVWNRGYTAVFKLK